MPIGQYLAEFCRRVDAARLGFVVYGECARDRLQTPFRGDCMKGEYVSLVKGLGVGGWQYALCMFFPWHGCERALGGSTNSFFLLADSAMRIPLTVKSARTPSSVRFAHFRPPDFEPQSTAAPCRPVRTGPSDSCEVQPVFRVVFRRFSPSS